MIEKKQHGIRKTYMLVRRVNLHVAKGNSISVQIYILHRSLGFFGLESVNVSLQLADVFV